MTDRDLLLALRRALLIVLDAIEEKLDIQPRNSVLRKQKIYANIAMRDEIIPQ